jgi:hypothetical protein
MSRTTTNRTGTPPMRTADQDLETYPDESQGLGWQFFAATMLGIAGIMRIIDSIWAFGYKGALPEGLKDGVLGSNLETYAWVWLCVGGLLLLSSVIVITGSQFARWFGIIAAFFGGVSAIAWMPYYPVWSLVYIGIAIMVVYALAVYGGRQIE